MQYTFALAGNQNSGKTTLFNQLTGSSQHVGNWPGVTVEKKTGAMLHHHHGQQTHLGLPRRFRRAHENGQAVPDKYSDVTIVDLPGIYSLSPYSMEEIVSRNFIVQEKPDVVINIVDATNLERNLYLTLQLLQLGRPVVVALNMMDEVRSHGDVIDLAAMEKGLGVPVVAICARKGEGLDELVRRAMDAALEAPEAIAILNKQDLPGAIEPSDLPFSYIIPVSCKDGTGFDLLEQAFDMLFPDDAPCDGSLLTNARQAGAILRAKKSVDSAVQSLRAGMTPDAVLVDLEAAMDALGEVTGRTMREDITNRIFERFCVGK